MLVTKSDEKAYEGNPKFRHFAWLNALCAHWHVHPRFVYCSLFQTIRDNWKNVEIKEHYMISVQYSPSVHTKIKNADEWQ